MMAWYDLLIEEGWFQINSGKDNKRPVFQDFRYFALRLCSFVDIINICPSWMIPVISATI